MAKTIADLSVVPEGARVTVLAEDEQAVTFEVDAAGEAELLAAAGRQPFSRAGGLWR